MGHQAHADRGQGCRKLWVGAWGRAGGAFQLACRLGSVRETRQVLTELRDKLEARRGKCGQAEGVGSARGWRDPGPFSQLPAGGAGQAEATGQTQAKPRLLLVGGLSEGHQQAGTLTRSPGFHQGSNKVRG